MRVNAALQQIRRGNHFQANALRGGNELICPFLGVDHAWMSAPTFPEHSHAGLSAVTYVFMDAKTGYDNRDSLGTRNLIRPGGLHWTTAGRGIRHEEIPAEPGKTAHSLQIFVDLAVDMRDMEPFALSLEPDELPVLSLESDVSINDTSDSKLIDTSGSKLSNSSDSKLSDSSGFKLMETDGYK